MPTRHAILGPSSAYRNLTCTPSARFEEQIPEEESDYADEGTLAHDLAALILSVRAGIYKGSQKRLNRMIDDIKVQVVDFYTKKKEEDPEAGFYTMMEYAEEWAGIILDYQGEIFVEREYDLGAYMPLGFGTADGTNMLPKVLYISDLKYGAGVPVKAKDNTQLKLYGLGGLLKALEMGYKPETVVLTIFQPRAGGLSTWEISTADLLKWADQWVKPRAVLAIAGEGEFIPGDHCQFCKARTRCAAWYGKFGEVLGIKDSREMTARDLATVLKYGSTLKTWINKVEAEAVKKLQSRKPVPGFKLVAGRGRRSFRNEDDVVDILLGAGYESDQIFSASLRSLTDLEKELRPKRFKELLGGEIINIDGNPQIAPQDDDRPAVGASAADDYDDDNLL